VVKTTASFGMPAPLPTHQFFRSSVFDKPWPVPRISFTFNANPCEESTWFFIPSQQNTRQFSSHAVTLP